MRQRRTCDRCYKIKARCVYYDASQSCARCFRLGHDCVGAQAAQRSERPLSASRNEGGNDPNNLTHNMQLARLNQPSSWPHSLTNDEKTSVDFLLQPAQIAELLYGLTFRDSMRSAMAGPFFSAVDQLKDGYVALAMALQEIKTTEMLQLVRVPHTWRASKALQILRERRPTSMQDARISLSLALVLVTYNDLNIGGPTLPIARSALLQAEPFWRGLSSSGTQDTDPHLICLLFCEVFECLVLGQLPVFRYEGTDGKRGLDRYYGICHDLLPHLYDVCGLYRSIKGHGFSNEQVEVEMRRLNLLLEQWNPTAEIAERTKFLHDCAERQHFLLQAKSFKCATELLLIQTQRSPGMNLLARAKSIQLEEYIIQARQCGIGRPKYLLFPYFVACIELHSLREGYCEEVLNNMHDISNGNAPKSCKTMAALLKFIWHSRQQTPDLTWFECVSERLQISMGP